LPKSCFSKALDYVCLNGALRVTWNNYSGAVVGSNAMDFLKSEATD
jgi:hypothetical protein